MSRLSVGTSSVKLVLGEGQCLLSVVFQDPVQPVDGLVHQLLLLFGVGIKVESLVGPLELACKNKFDALTHTAKMTF